MVVSAVLTASHTGASNTTFVVYENTYMNITVPPPFQHPGVGPLLRYSVETLAPTGMNSLTVNSTAVSPTPAASKPQLASPDHPFCSNDVYSVCVFSWQLGCLPHSFTKKLPCVPPLTSSGQPGLCRHVACSAEHAFGLGHYSYH